MSRPSLERLDHLAEVIKEQCEIRKLWLLCGFSVVYWISTCLLALRKLIWNDELFTLYTSRLPKISDIWASLLTGADQISPLFPLITRASFSLFGVNSLSVRLPEVLGFWVMSLCLFHFVCKRSSALHGCAAMLLPLVTAAYEYAYEARPYGVVLGFSGLSLVFWQSAADGHYRKISLIGLALALAAAVSAHYYAILLFVPLALGELACSISRRRLHLGVWVAFGSALLPLLLFLPLLESAAGYSGAFWARPNWRSLPEFYYFLLTPALLPLVSVLLFSAIYAVPDVAGDNLRTGEPRRTPPFYEIIAAFGFVGIPVVAVVLGIFVTHAFTYRYALPAVAGFGILFAFAAYGMLHGRAIIGVLLVIALCGGFMMLVVHRLGNMTAAAQELAETYRFLQSPNETTLPIVAADLHTFMRLKYYAPQGVGSRLVYLADPKASLKYLGYDTVDRGILDLEPWFRLNVREYGPYVMSQRRFFVYGQPGFLNWLFYELPKANVRIELKARNGDNLLFLVSVSGKQQPK